MVLFYGIISVTVYCCKALCAECLKSAIEIQLFIIIIIIIITTCWDHLPGGDEAGGAAAQDRAHLRGPGVPRTAGEGPQQGQAHPGGGVLLPEIQRDLPRAHLDHVQQGQLSGHATVTEHLDPVPLPP